MTLEPDEIQEFQKLIEEEFGKKITAEEAIVTAERLLSLYELIHQPLPKEQAMPPASADDRAPRALETTPAPSETSDPAPPTKL